MKKGFTTFLSALKANTPPCKKGLSSLRFLSLFLILFLAVGNVWGQELVLSTTDNASTASDWNKSYTNVVLTTYLDDGEVKFASKKACGASSNVSTISLSGADSYYFDISLTSAAASNYTLEKVVLRVAGNSNSSGATDYTAPLFYSTSSTFDVNNVAGVMDIAYTGYDKSCDDNEYIFPENTKSCRLYRRAKYTEPNGEEPGKVGTGSNYSCSNQTLHITYLEVYLKSATIYTVTYNANGGSGTMEPTTNEIVECSFTYDGKDFVEWNTAADGTGTSYAVGDAVTDNLNLYAIWEAEKPKYDVTYSLNGGTGTAPTQGKVAENGTFTVASAEGITPPAGKEFAGWSDGTNTYAAGATYTMGAAAVTFTAQWKAAPTVLFHYQWTGSGTQPSVNDILIGNGGTITVERKEGSTKTLSNESAKFVSSVPSDMKFTTSDSKGVKFGTSDVWFRIALNSGNFEEGDTIAICGYGAFLISSSTADGDIISSLSTGSSKESYEVKQCVIPSIESFPNLYIRRESSSCGFAAIKVIRPAQKEILSEDITLSAVTVNTEAVSDENLATLKADPYKLDMTSEYAEAPTIAFTKQTVITYEDATTKTKTEAIEVEAAKVDGKWQAQAEINGVTYTVTAIVPATYTVIYKDGETELASEIVKVGEHPTAEGVETKPLYALSWKLAEEVVELANVNGTPDQEIILTAVWTPKYATSLDFAAITTAGTTGDNPIVDFLASGNMIASNLGSSEWETSTGKSGYVGYKLKNNGATITFLAQEDKRVTITFGSIAADVTLKKGDETVTISAKSGDDAETVYNLDVTTDMVVAITTSSGSTITLKSITIGDIPATSDDATLKDLKVNGTTIEGFNSATKIYYLTVPYGTEVANMPKITEATANHASAAAVIYPAEGPEWTEEYGGCYLQQVVVTAEDEITKGYYHVRTTVDAKQGVSLIKATHTGATTADVTGYIGGSVDKNTQGGGKLGEKDHYFGIKLAEGTFLEGDVVTIYASTVSSKVQIFSDKGTTMINEGVFDGNYYTYTLTEATEWIYLYRTETAGSAMNPTLGYIEVQRDMAPFIESFVIGDAVGTINQTNKTIAIEVPASADVTALEPTIVAWANGGATVTPTGAQDFTNPVTYTVSSAYAEDGETEYTVTVTKAVPSAEPTINTQPQSATYIEGAVIEALTIEVTAEGTLTYQWQQKNGDNWENIAEATSASYQPTISTIGSYIYRCVVTNKESGKTETSIISDEATLTITIDPNCGLFETVPTAEPYNYTATGLWTIYNANSSGKRDDSNVFATGKDYADNTVNIFGKQRCVLIFEKDVKQVTFYTNNGSTGRKWAGSDPIKVSDDKDNFLGTETPDYTAMDATTSMEQEGDNDKIVLTAEGNFEAGKVYLFNFSSTVKIFRICVVEADPKAEVPVLNADLMDEEICEGSTFATLDATASPVTAYAWYKDGVVIDGATAATYTPTEGGKYYCIATNAPDGFRAMSVKTTEVTLASFASAEILSAPENVRMDAGETATLAVVATGKNVTYQWYTCDENGDNAVLIDGAEAATYQVEVTAAMHQYYKVVVGSGCGEASAVALVEEWHEIAPANVTGSRTWDWAAESMGEIATESGSVEYLMANVSSQVPNTEAFRSDMLYITANFANRGASNKFFQGWQIRFYTEVPGRVSLECRAIHEKVSITINGTVIDAERGGSMTPATTPFFVPAGWVTIVFDNTSTGEYADEPARVQKIVFNATPDYTRSGLTVGSLGTICLPSNVPAGHAFGATFYKLEGKEPQYGKIVFDEILSGELAEGVPYLFQAQSDVLYCFYGTESATEPDNSGAMKGTFVDMTLTNLTNIYYFAQKALWSCVDLTSLSVPANRAYVKMDEMPAITESNPAPGVRRITLGVNGQQVATGVDQVQGEEVPTKMIINGQLFILRGEKMYDAQGKLVK